MYRLPATDKALPERGDVGRALSHEGKVSLLKVAANKPEWQVARLAVTLALNTTMRACEILELRERAKLLCGSDPDRSGMYCSAAKGRGL